MDSFEGFSQSDLRGTLTGDNMFEIYVSPESDNITINFFVQSTRDKMR
jgi:hypothetical protein